MVNVKLCRVIIFEDIVTKNLHKLSSNLHKLRHFELQIVSFHLPDRFTHGQTL